MQSPLDKYQKAQKTESSVKKNKSDRTSVVKKASSSAARRTIKKNSPKDINPTPWVFLSALGLLTCLYILNDTENFLTQMKSIKVSFSSAKAEDGEKNAEPKASSSEKEEKISTDEDADSVSTLVEGDPLTMEKSNVFKSLKAKERQLNKKSRDLARLEEDLHLQKKEIEKQLKELSEMRQNISSKIERREVADQESLERLVGIYSDMKPQNAALVMSQLDEKLAVEVMGQMKKQNAAAILNFMGPEKAQTLTEKFAGLKD